MSYTPLIIVGAPRSGTNMLRDVLCSFPGVATWPCDEINYIWRVGHVDFPTDELTPDLVTPKTRAKIRRAFDWVARKYNADVVVEKTCATSLRVPFVEAVLDQPVYVYIVRDGVDAAASATDRWRASLDIPYLARKARFVPRSELPIYAYRYAQARVKRLRSGERRLSTWGPKFDGLEQAAQEESTVEVAARQWQACVDASDDAFAAIPADRVHRVRYEDLVEKPQQTIAALVADLGWDIPEDQVAAAVSGVSSSSVGKGRASLSESELATVVDILEPTLARHGYAT
jgi:hypothetical protein